jgi:uncharacterized protein (DUF1330 family)
MRGDGTNFLDRRTVLPSAGAPPRRAIKQKAEISGRRTMPAYIIATVRISDPERFALYAKGIAGLSEKFGGEAVVKGPVAEVLEGDGLVGERGVVSRYPDAASARAYIASPEYQAAAAHRVGAAEVVMRLIEA